VNQTTTGIEKATSELYRLYRLLNHVLFEDQLPEVVVTIQKSDTRSSLGWTSVNRVWVKVTPSQAGEAVTEQSLEVNITAENLARPVADIAATMVHEMVHVLNISQGVRDVSGHQYHNKAFRVAAEAALLEVQHVEGYGWAVTNPSAALKSILGSCSLSQDAFLTFRLARPTKTGPGPRGGSSKMKKWSCGCTNVRCAVELAATCEWCQNKFVEQ
jgi:hypothetical protein